MATTTAKTTPPRGAVDPNAVLFPKQVAAIMGTTERSARRLLARLEETHGETVVGKARCNGQMTRYVVAGAFMQIVDPRVNPKYRAIRSENRHDDVLGVKDMVESLRRQVDRLEREVAEMRRRGSS